MIMIKPSDTLISITILIPEFEKYVIQMDPNAIPGIEQVYYYPILENKKPKVWKYI